jgi:hypothetical protein
MFGTIPMWPEFSDEATMEGTVIWGIFTAWVYILPVTLLATRSWWHERNDMMEK